MDHFIGSDSLSGHSYGVFCLGFNYISALAVISCNKVVLQFFPHPGLLTTIHYVISSISIEILFQLQALSMTPEDNSVAFCMWKKSNIKPFSLLVLAWTLCNVLSNFSLEKNSVGFYQMVKILTTPTVVIWNYAAYKRVVTTLQAFLLGGACLGVWLATANDREATRKGTIFAFLAVYVAAVQKIANSHMQQQCGMSSFGLMRLAMPFMAILTFGCVTPFLDPPGGLETLCHLTSHQSGLVLLSGVAGLCASLSATMVYGAVGVLAHVLLGQLKMTSVLLLGSLFFDKPTSGRSKLGASIAVISISVYTVLTVHLRKKGQKQVNGKVLPLTTRHRYD